MSIYNVDYAKFIQQLLPPVLRKPVMVSYLYSLSRPIRELHKHFTIYHRAKRKELLFNGQVIKLEWLLNELFNESEPGIHIVHNEVTQGAFFLFNEGYTSEAMEIFKESDGKGPYLYKENEMTPPDAAFTVMVPAALELDEAALRAWVSKYKLFGSTYNIQQY